MCCINRLFSFPPFRFIRHSRNVSLLAGCRVNVNWKTGQLNFRKNNISEYTQSSSGASWQNPGPTEPNQPKSLAIPEENNWHRKRNRDNLITQFTTTFYYVEVFSLPRACHTSLSCHGLELGTWKVGSHIHLYTGCSQQQQQQPIKNGQTDKTTPIQGNTVNRTTNYIYIPTSIRHTPPGPTILAKQIHIKY